MAFRPGELDQYVTVQNKTETTDDIGGSSFVWADKFDIWAHVRSLSGREVEDFDRLNANARYLFVVRWPVDILPDDAFLWEGDRYNIRVIKKPKGRDLYCQVEAERGVAQ